MSNAVFEIETLKRLPIRSQSKAIMVQQERIGSGVALASNGIQRKWSNNPYHWQTLVLLIPLFHNPLPDGFRKPISKALLLRTMDEMQAMFSGYTLNRAMGWYVDGDSGVSDDLIRFEIDGIFMGHDLRKLHEWKKKLERRFRQDYIYMRLVPSGVAV